MYLEGKTFRSKYEKLENTFKELNFFLFKVDNGNLNEYLKNITYKTKYIMVI